ncbi:hypothetical protein TIFTF001_034428 [Ficus carica]|uniref:Uncharacterized protein n=1 Tax=Ficus carica TaxID=3494 RepID=A0AA88J553_FICCA|nr:hypothetical protein TIFTF001_034428 [Ficus carica]
MVDLRSVIRRSKRVNNGHENPAILVPPTLPSARIGPTNSGRGRGSSVNVQVQPVVVEEEASEL